MNLKKLFEKYKDVFLYLFFGICTTIINIVVYWILVHPLHKPVMIGTIAAWFFAVLFAYITNKKWVFQSTVTGVKEIFIEMMKFFVARLISGFVDWFCMFMFVNIYGMDDVIIKILSNILVIIFNYIASKIVIFKK